MKKEEREKLLAELEEKHGEIKSVETALGMAVFRGPTRAEYKRFRAAIHDPRKKADATEMLVRDCVVHPSPEEFDRWCDKKPATPEVCSDAVLTLAGITDEAEAGKA